MLWVLSLVAAVASDCSWIIQGCLMVFCLAGSKLNVIGEKMQNGARIESLVISSLSLVWIVFCATTRSKGRFSLYFHHPVLTAIEFCFMCCVASPCGAVAERCVMLTPLLFISSLFRSLPRWPRSWTPAGSSCWRRRRRSPSSKPRGTTPGWGRRRLSSSWPLVSARCFSYSPPPPSSLHFPQSFPAFPSKLSCQLQKNKTTQTTTAMNLHPEEA